MEASELKRQAAWQAVDSVESGMVVGLGVGSTAIWAVRRLAELIGSGRLTDIVAVPCSIETGKEARRLGIPLTTLDDHPIVDLTIDGADEVDPNLDLIKGGGGALLREKIVAQASRREIIVVDDSKFSPVLGTQWAVPVEVLEFGLGSHIHFLESLKARPVLRHRPDGAPYRTDENNLIVDCHFGPIANVGELAAKLDGRAGIVEHGLFVGLATEVIGAGEGGIRHLKR